MAFSWAGDLTGAKPIIKRFQVGVDCYQGQLAGADISKSTGGYVKPAPVAAAYPDTATRILGIITGIVTSPVYTASYYKGDLATYDVTCATLQANSPVGPAYAEVALITPTTLIKAPIYHTTPGVALHALKATTAVAAGTTFVTSGFDAAVDGYSTAYCRGGSNRGEYRKVDGTGTTTQTFVIPWTYGVAIGDEFVVANIVEGQSHIDLLGTYVNGIDGTAALTNYYCAYVHELNLEESGKEYAVFTLCASHLVIGSALAT
jgi:hypothetical protein